MEVSTVEFYTALKEIALGITTNAETNAKKVSDYVEQTKQTNYSTLKDVFLTKDDKVDLINKINDSKWDMIKVMLGAFIALALMIIGLYFKK